MQLTELHKLLLPLGIFGLVPGRGCLRLGALLCSRLRAQRRSGGLEQLGERLVITLIPPAAHVAVGGWRQGLRLLERGSVEQVG